MLNLKKSILLLIGLIFLFSTITRAADTRGRLVVLINDSSKKPIKDVTITLKSTESSEVSYTITTNSKGKATIAGIDPIVFLVRAEKEGYQFLEGEVKLRPGVKHEESWTMKTMEEAKEDAKATAIAGMSEEQLAQLKARDLHNKGVEAYQNGKTNEAKKFLLDAIAADPNVSYVDYLLLGNISFNEKNADDTIKYLEKAKELDKEGQGKSDISKLLGASYMIKKEYEKAKTAWSEIAATEADPTLLYNLANIEIQMGNLEGAVKWLETCKEKAPEFADGLILLGDIYLQDKKNDKALVVYEQALAVLKKNPDANPEQKKLAEDTVKVLKEQARNK